MAFLGSLRIAHSAALDETDRHIMKARYVLNINNIYFFYSAIPTASLLMALYSIIYILSEPLGVCPYRCPSVAAVWTDQLRATSLHVLILGKCYSVHIIASSL